MRRTVTLAGLCMALLVVMSAGAALARTINGDDGNNILIGTDRSDVIRGFGGDDVIRGRGGNDVLIGGLGDDTLVGGRGNDTIDAVDGSGGDFVVCGSGFDKVRADVGDIVSTNCEDVQRVEDVPPPPPNNQTTDCSDNLDNDGDGRTDFPNDPGCFSASDPSELNDQDGGNGIDCSDNLDNDGDGKTDFPNDPGCSSANDPSEAEDNTPPANEADCSDNLDNDGDGKTDFPNDPGCSSASDPSEVNASNGDGNGEVICHKPGTPAEKTKTVPESAVKAHLGHGDTLGPCDGDDGDDD
jgi:hypothetical protein